ncbi:MAG: hypothetical protein KF758_16145 [Anaerolineales bacterium]|nr:hypothetical protein [Anaerolineales bacterium]
MKKTKEFFLQEFEKQIKFNKKHAHSNIGYGENVMPTLELYAKLDDYDERMSYKDALVELLTHSDKNKRDFAVDICLGFFIFRSAIRPNK